MLGSALSLIAVGLQSISLMLGDFTYSEIKDPLDDTFQVVGTLKADDAEVNIWCDLGRARTIVVTLETPRYLVASPSPLLENLMPFKYRIDQNAAHSAFASYGLSTAILKGAEARAFAERLAAGSRLHIRVLGASGDIDASFAAAGSRSAIEKIAERCGDKRLIKRLARSAP